MKLSYLSRLRLPTKNAHGFQIMNMCHAFSTLDVDVELVIPQRKNILKADPFDFYNIPRSFRIIRLPVIDLYFFRFIPEKISYLLEAISFLISSRIYFWFNKTDILYTREKFASLVFKKYVYEVHMPEQLKVKGFSPYKVVVLNKYIKDQFVARGYKSEDILISSDAVDLSKFMDVDKKEAREKLKLDKNKNVVLYWGNFKEWKGVDTLANAAFLLSEPIIVMIGGTKESDIKRIQEKTHGLENVIILGFQDQSEMPTYLAAADILVLPNSGKDENSRYYTSPLKLFEYMAAQRPIIASDLQSLREVLNEENAVFFEPDNPSDLANAVKNTLNNPTFTVQIATKAKQDVEQYTWENRAAKILRFLNE